MFPVTPEQLTELRAFFADPPPNAPMLYAFLDGRAPGRVFVDRLGDAGACVVAMNYSFVFFGGQPTPDFIHEALGWLRRDQFLHVVWPVGGLPRSPAPDQAVDRIEYRQRIDFAGALLRQAFLRIPEGGRVRRIDAELMKRCMWREEAAFAAGSIVEFLLHGVGFCLLIGEEIVSEAYSCFWGLDRVEIATITHRDHRGKGYAAAVCAYLIDACEKIGFSTYWSCDATNMPSRRLAARLGFSDPCNYRLLRYRRSMAAAFA
ncbi:MAG TPA: GNAT family N-acetyltransferase [Opitutaceae bacterium]